jgi:hypothetical protein
MNENKEEIVDLTGEDTSVETNAHFIDEYQVDFDKVNTVEDIKTIFKALDIRYGNIDSLEDAMKDMLVKVG